MCLTNLWGRFHRKRTRGKGIVTNGLVAEYTLTRKTTLVGCLSRNSPEETQLSSIVVKIKRSSLLEDEVEVSILSGGSPFALSNQFRK